MSSVLAEVAVAFGVVQQVELSGRRRVVHDAYPLNSLALRGLRADQVAVRIVWVARGNPVLDELPIGVGRFVAGVPVLDLIQVVDPRS